MVAAVQEAAESAPTTTENWFESGLGNSKVLMRKIAHDIGISDWSVRRTAKENLHLKPYKLLKVELLTDDNKRVRPRKMQSQCNHKYMFTLRMQPTSSSTSTSWLGPHPFHGWEVNHRRISLQQSERQKLVQKDPRKLVCCRTLAKS